MTDTHTAVYCEAGIKKKDQIFAVSEVTWLEGTEAHGAASRAMDVTALPPLHPPLGRHTHRQTASLTLSFVVTSQPPVTARQQTRMCGVMSSHQQRGSGRCGFNKSSNEL